jgi:hypothetical protein
MPHPAFVLFHIYCPNVRNTSKVRLNKGGKLILGTGNAFVRGRLKFVVDSALKHHANKTYGKGAPTSTHS